MGRRSITGILAVGLIAIPAANGWDQVNDFEGLPLGTVKGHDEGAPIAELVRVTRDEGWEGGREGGFAAHVVTGNGADGRMYHLATGGHGEAWGHVFAAIALEHPISLLGTVYLQVAHQGGSNEYGIALAAEPVEPVDPPTATNPWGWTGPLAWGHMHAGILKRADSALHVIQSTSPPAMPDTGFDLLPGPWYEIWLVADIAANRYEVHVRGGQFEEQTVITVEPTHALEPFHSILIGTIAGSPSNPNRGDVWYINAFAVDYENENLSTPGALAQLPPPLEFEHRFGFPLVEGEWTVDTGRFLGSRVQIEFAPWAYSHDLATWIYLDFLDGGTGEPPDPTEDRSRKAGTWAYILNLGN